MPRIKPNGPRGTIARNRRIRERRIAKEVNKVLYGFFDSRSHGSGNIGGKQ